MKLLWKLKLEQTACDAQPVCATRRRARHHRRGHTRSRAVRRVGPSLRHRRPARQLWHRRFDSTLVKPGGTNDNVRLARRSAAPTTARHRPGADARSTRCRGRAASADQPGGRPGHRTGEEVHPGWRQTLFNLHNGVIDRHRARLWRPDECVLLVRPRRRVGRARSFPRVGDCGAAVVVRPSIPRGRVFRTGDAEFDPLTRRLGNGIVRKLDEKKQLQLSDYFACRMRTGCGGAICTSTRRRS